MTFDRKVVYGAISTLVIASLVGCGSSSDPKLSALRERFLLASEPQDALSISEIKKQFAKNEATFEVALIGRVASRDLASFDEHRPVFSISELPTAGHDDASGHDEENCAFCRHRAELAPVALIEMVDDKGATVPYGAAQLLGLRKGDVLVVRGQAQVNNKLDLLTVRADAIFIRR